jgi:hypothetical protein
MRHLTSLILVLALIPSLGAADTMYKWVDAQGNVHYSDKPAPGATKIDVPKARTFTPPQVAAPAQNTETGSRRSQTQQRAAAGYTAISISSPQDQQTLWNVPSVTVSVNLEPALQAGDSLIITLDGASQTVHGNSATFADVDRGQHTASASVGGISSQPITFFVQKTSAQKPPMH